MRGRGQVNGSSGERGAFLIIWALLLVALFTMVAFVIDLGYHRSIRRQNQATVDLAALAGGPALAGKTNGAFAADSQQACLDAFQNAKDNIHDAPTSFTAATPDCSSLPTALTCNLALAAGTPLPPATNVTISGGPYTVTVTYPVPDAQITDTHFSGTSTTDGSLCERLKVSMVRTYKSFFGGVLGSTGGTSRAQSVVHGAPKSSSREVPSFVMLERTTCSVVQLSGGSAQIRVNQTTTAQHGFMQVDTGAFDGGSDCNSTGGGNPTNGPSGFAVYAAPATPPRILVCPGGAGILCTANNPADPGRMAMYSLQLPTTSAKHAAYCYATQPAPNLGSCTSNPGINVTPEASAIVSRTPVDDKYNTTHLSGLFDTGWPNRGTSNGAVEAFRLHGQDVVSGAATAAALCFPGSLTCPYPYNSSAVISGSNCGPGGGNTLPATVNNDFIYVNCGTFEPSGGGGSSLTLHGKVVVFSGAINVKSTEGLAIEAPEVVINGPCPGSTSACPPGSRQAIQASGKFLVNTGGNPATYDPTSSSCATRTQALGVGTVRMVVESGTLEGSGTVAMCQTFGLLAGGIPAPSTLTSDPSHASALCSTTLPCPLTSARGSSWISVSGAFDWSAPDQISGPFTQSASTVANAYEDLALWSETFSPGSSPSSITPNIGTGGATLRTAGVFFMPNDGMRLAVPSGGASPRAAQLLIRWLNLSAGVLDLQPNPNSSVTVPAPGTWSLIR